MITTYERYVSDDCEDVLSEVLGHYTVSDPEPRVVYESVMLHHYLYHNVDNRWRDHKTDPLRTFRGTWAIGSGNCEEKSIVLCSLLRQLPGLDTHFVTVENEDHEGHALVEVHYTDYRDPDRVAELLRDAYRDIEEIDCSAEEIHWETTNRDEWFIADPIKSEYVGDLSQHVADGYVTKHDDYWEWHRIKDKGIHHPG